MLLNVDVLLIYPVVIFLVRDFYLSASACVSDVCVGSATFLGRRNNSTKVGCRELDGVRGVTQIPQTSHITTHPIDTINYYLRQGIKTGSIVL